VEHSTTRRATQPLRRLATAARGRCTVDSLRAWTRWLEEAGVTADHTQKVIDRYFEVMGARGDFSQFYVDEVTWTMVDAGAQIRGAAAVRDYVIALHVGCSGRSETLIR
jgi:hypothetical protein